MHDWMRSWCMQVVDVGVLIVMPVGLVVGVCFVGYVVVDVERKREEETGTVHEFYPRPGLQTARENARGIAVRFGRFGGNNIMV